jgi:hypothetical protein
VGEGVAESITLFARLEEVVTRGPDRGGILVLVWAGYLERKEEEVQPALGYKGTEVVKI